MFLTVAAAKSEATQVLCAVHMIGFPFLVHESLSQEGCLGLGCSFLLCPAERENENFVYFNRSNCFLKVIRCYNIPVATPQI